MGSRWRTTFLMYLLILGACSSQPRPGTLPPSSGAENFEPIPGVDSIIVVLADSLAEDLFVSFEKEEEASELFEVGKREFAESDTLFSLKKIFDLAGDSSVVVTAEDTSKAIEYFNNAYDQYEKAEKLFERYRQDESSRSLGQKITDHLMRAREATLKSIEINPFDMDALWLMSVIYRYLAVIFEEHQNFVYAVSVLKELIEMDRGDHSLYYELGYNFFKLGEWENALTNFQKAEDLLYENATIDFSSYKTNVDSLESAEEDTSPADNVTAGVENSAGSTEQFVTAAVDTSALFSYVSGQAECLTKLYRSEEALQHFEKAGSLSTGEEKQHILQRIEWIQWDNGAIRNVELRDSLIIIERSGAYEKAHTGYTQLLSRLSSQTAADEIEWKIATIDYAVLHNKAEGVERLRKVIQRAKMEGVLNEEDEVVDSDPESLYPTFLEDYGTMCYNLALDYLMDKKQRKEAFAYLLQASEVSWGKRGGCFVELIKLARNNPGKLIEFGENALKCSLSREEKLFVYKQLVNAYKRKGRGQDFDKARTYFNEWKKLAKK